MIDTKQLGVYLEQVSLQVEEIAEETERLVSRKQAAIEVVNEHILELQRVAYMLGEREESQPLSLLVPIGDSGDPEMEVLEGACWLMKRLDDADARRRVCGYMMERFRRCMP
jgi:hypothetical protein